MASVISFRSLTASLMQEQDTALSKGMGSVSVEATNKNTADGRGSGCLGGV